MLMRWLACGLLLLGGTLLFSQNISIEAINKDYSGKSIDIIVSWNPFMTAPEYTSSEKCNNEGVFLHQFELEFPRVVQFETGIYQAYLYMEPGFHYKVELPEYREKKFDEEISAFFQPVVLPLRVISRTSIATGEEVDEKQDLNYTIARFDTAFTIVNEEVVLNRRMEKQSDVDSMIQNLEVRFSEDTTLFFSSYRRYRYGVLRLNEGKTGLESLSRDYLGPVIREWHPGFIELFRAMFKDFIFYYSSTTDGKELIHQINRTQDLDGARSILMQHPAVWNDTLADMILLQELSDIFYRGDFHKEAILILLDSMVHDAISPKFAIYTSQILKKLSSLVVGFPPPTLTLLDLEGNPCTLSDFEGKYIYLFFGTPEHYGCMMEYPFLQSFHEKHSEYLQVVTVMISEERDELDDFMLRNGYDWKVLHYEGQPGLLSDYMVRAFPTAYLIGRDGNLILSPSTLPSDGFEQQLFRIMRSRGEI